MTEQILNTSYKKSLGKNYMIIDLAQPEVYLSSGGSFKDFRIRMIHENNIPGLLNSHIQYIDDIPSFQYDITGMQSLEVILDTVPLTHPLLCKIFSAIYNCLLSIENYLLVHDHIMLSPEYIYLTADYTDIRLCYCPICGNCFNDSIGSLFDYLLKRVDHSDEKCVYLAYSMHKSAIDPDFNINKLYSQLSSIPKDLPPVITPHISGEQKNQKEILTTTLPAKSNEILEDKPHYLNNEHYLGKNQETRHISEGKMKLFLLVIASVFTVSVSSILYFLDFYPLSFYGILLLTILIIIFYNGYHLHRQYAPTKLDAIVSSNQQKSVSNTVILAAGNDDNTHKLIYTGVGNGEDISLTHYPFVIGKTESCSAKLTNSAISRLHAKLSLLPVDDDSHDIFVEDLNSTNGTLLNNNPLTPYEKYPITSGDYITFGHLTYIFR